MKLNAITIGELIAPAGARLVRGDLSTTITNVQYDSRKIEPGGLFVALRGSYADGHDFLQDARERGAVAALVESTAGTEDYPVVAVANNTREALAPLAARFYQSPGNDFGIIGVTGTDGKTTTSYLIEAMLRANGFRTGLVGTISIRIGDRVTEHDARQTTPESLEVQRLLAEMRDDRVDWAVLEATSHGLELYRLNNCPFDVGVITNITREHLDFHGSVEAYREAKAELIRKVESTRNPDIPAFAVINKDDEAAREIGTDAHLPVYWFSGTNPRTDLYADNILVHSGGTKFRLHAGDLFTVIDLKLIGGYNVFNAMAAAGVGLGIGLGLDDVRRGLESLTHVPGRMQRIEQGQPFNVIVDYAHSPASLTETLELLRSVTQGKLIVVSGSAGERDRGKRAVQGGICAELADLSIFTSEDPRFEDPDEIIREIAEGASEAGAVEGIGFHLIEDRREAIDAALRSAEPGDTVLLAGKGHEQSMIYGDQRRPWNEAVEAERALRRLGYIVELSESEGTG